VIAAVVLAAGESSRLGRPKQLVEFRGRSLIRGAVEAAREAGCSPVVVVLGAKAETVRREIDPLERRCCRGPIAGVESATETPRTQASHQHHVDHADREVPVEGGVLGHVAHSTPGAGWRRAQYLHASAVRCEQPEDDLE